MGKTKKEILGKTYITKKEMAILLDTSPASITKMFSEKYTSHENIPDICTNSFGGNTCKYLTTDVIKWFKLEAFVKQIGIKKASRS
jgi:hypothetical protein